MKTLRKSNLISCHIHIKMIRLNYLWSGSCRLERKKTVLLRGSNFFKSDIFPSIYQILMRLLVVSLSIVVIECTTAFKTAYLLPFPFSAVITHFNLTCDLKLKWIAQLSLLLHFPICLAWTGLSYTQQSTAKLFSRTKREEKQ